MDRRENTLLEDWYRFAYGKDRRYGRGLGTNLDGYLCGTPEFVVDGDCRGFRFDGKTQYGELCPRLADLGAITVEVTVKWEGKGIQTIFDFGSSTDDCFVLKTSPKGKPEFVAMVGGKTVVALTANKALGRNEWVTLRVEIDGSRTSVWMNGDKVAEKASEFRPCDAFQGAKEKRNFVAASRGGRGYFKGIIDRVVVYHTVHDDFGKAPAPTRDAPRRPTGEVIAAIEKARGNIEELNRKIDALARKTSEPYNKYKTRQEARARELEKRSPALEAAKVKLKEVEEALGKRKGQLGREFDRLPETLRARAEIDKMRKESSELRSRFHKLLSERLSKDTELAAIRADRKETEEKFRALERKLHEDFEKRPGVVKERKAVSELRKNPDKAARKKASDRERLLNELRNVFRKQNAEYVRFEKRRRDLPNKQRQRENLLREELNKAHPKLVSRQREVDRTSGAKDRVLRGKRDMYISKQSAEMVRQVGAAKTAVAEASDKAMAPYWPEKLWMGSFGYQVYRGYYNTNYGSYIRSYARVQVGGGEMRDDVGFLKGLHKALEGDKAWRTSIDWDWRMRQEVDGTIKDLPLQQKWIRRVRGPVVTAEPTSVR